MRICYCSLPFLLASPAFAVSTLMKSRVHTYQGGALTDGQFQSHRVLQVLLDRAHLSGDHDGYKGAIEANEARCAAFESARGFVDSTDLLGHPESVVRPLGS